MRLARQPTRCRHPAKSNNNQSGKSSSSRRSCLLILLLHPELAASSSLVLPWLPLAPSCTHRSAFPSLPLSPPIFRFCSSSSTPQQPAYCSLPCSLLRPTYAHSAPYSPSISLSRQPHRRHHLPCCATRLTPDHSQTALLPFQLAPPTSHSIPPT